MANINLLPWREERRQELKKAFLAGLGFVAAVAVALLIGAFIISNAQIETQTARNAYLQKSIDELNRQVAEIKELEKRRDQLLERMKIIQALQGNRPVIVHLFDDVVRTLPDGVFYSEFGLKGKTISVKGIAESNNRVSSLMRNLDGSDWFQSPNLTAVKSEPEAGEQASAFDMTVELSPLPGEETASTSVGKKSSAASKKNKAKE
jgi:type IV pilus assembly protein PilN